MYKPDLLGAKPFRPVTTLSYTSTSTQSSASQTRQAVVT